MPRLFVSLQVISCRLLVVMIRPGPVFGQPSASDDRASHGANRQSARLQAASGSASAARDVLHRALGFAVSPPDGGGHPHDIREHTGEMALVSEAAFQRDIDNRNRPQQQFLRPVHTVFKQPSMWGPTGGILERLDEVAPREVACRGSAGDRQFTLIGRDKIILGACLLPPRKAPLRRTAKWRPP
jgi:hypothetical protein